ncbi:MAG: multidrug transporter AcrB [Betaproteobacteria bacterium HGW-Betaproteobacteria-11]|nr:MAG: multidrug transporter AcrB [Betaproteobacteria bacterium HGW-Betaproteobacteria-11]
MKRFNVSEWSLKHPSLVIYLMVVLMLAGILSYFKLGRAEDPDFTIKVMVVRTLWPGATAPEVAHELTERIEKKLQDTPWLDIIKSSSKPGESLIFVQLKDYTPKAEVAAAWYQVRKKLDDIHHTLPQGVLGPFPNDEFGDVIMNIFAVSGDDYSLGDLRQEADRIARELRLIPDVTKIEMIGVQDEKIYVEADPLRLAKLGLTPVMLFDALQKQNAVTPAGFIETRTDRVRLRVSGAYQDIEQIRATELILAGRHFRLDDIATVRRGLVDPPAPRFHHNGHDAIGIGVVMAKGGDVIHLGENLRQRIGQLKADLPAGMTIETLTDQPRVVDESIHLFIKSLAEAILIVLAVSFLSLGWRTGTVVALSIPLVLAVTFLLMKIFGIDLQRISLGALVIAMGLLVDDAIIVVEMMVVKVEQGWDRFKAATFAYTSTAFPMLTGTLITAAGFAPVGFAKSSAGEYTFSIFAVVTIALLVSWVVAVLFTPFIGYRLLDLKKLKTLGREHHGDVYDTPFYRRFRRLVEWCLHHRWRVIAATVGAFALAIVAFNTVVQKQFFPSASRPELMIDLWLPQGASLKATAHEVERVEKLLAGDPDVEKYASFIGNGAPRFYLPLDQQLFNDNFGQFLVLSKGLDEREVLKARLEKEFAAPDGSWSHVRTRVLRLENGPPVGYPVQFRVMGENLETLRKIAEQVAALMRQHPNLQDVHLDWNDKVKSVRVAIDQDRARALGVTSQDVALTLQAWLVGMPLTQLRENDQLIDIVWRAGERGGQSNGQALGHLPELDIVTASGRHVALAQVARLEPVLEEGLIWRRNRLPTITVRGDLIGKMQAPVVSMQIQPRLDAIRASLPPGYRIEMGGAIEESAKGEASIITAMPLMVVAVFTLLMLQLQSFSRTLMVVLTAPLGLIGVALALVVFQVSFGFVANLGVIALMGMIMRNSVILIDQIEQDEKAGKDTWEAIVSSTVRRLRPIALTAAAAILAMVPLARQVFWGPMAIAIMGGLMVATVLTCLSLPALYAAWFRVRAPGAA